MTPATEPCNCPQSLELAGRVRELESQLAGKAEMVGNWRVLHDDLAQMYIDARAELAALRSRLDPGSVEAVERVARVISLDEARRVDPQAYPPMASHRSLGRAILAALSKEGE